MLLMASYMIPKVYAPVPVACNKLDMADPQTSQNAGLFPDARLFVI